MHLHPHLTHQLVADRRENLRREFLTDIEHGSRRAGATRRRRDVPVSADNGRGGRDGRWHRRRTADST